MDCTDTITEKKASKAGVSVNPVAIALDGIPIMEVKAEGSFLYPGGKRGCHLVFKCPKCRRKIHHGGTYGKKGDGDGHRCAHCGCWPRGYYLKEV